MNAYTKPDIGQRALRKARVSNPGQIYFVTTVTAARHCFYDDTEAARATSRIFSDADVWHGSQVLAWVLMPDHGHLLLRLGDEESLPRFMQRIKSLTARATNFALSRHGQVWQPTYHDHALRADDDVVASARYLIANPIRAGLVTRVGEYPYWNAAWLAPDSDPLNP